MQYGLCAETPQEILAEDEASIREQIANRTEDDQVEYLSKWSYWRDYVTENQDEYDEIQEKYTEQIIELDFIYDPTKVDQYSEEELLKIPQYTAIMEGRERETNEFIKKRTKELLTANQ